MKKVISLFLSFYIFTTVLYAQLAIGDWQAEMAYYGTTVSAPFNGRVYAISKGSLFSYDPEDYSIVTYEPLSLTSDVVATHLAYCPSQRTLLIAYDNCNIDLMDENENFYNLADFKNKTMTDKSINSIHVKDEFAYLATDFGVVVVNIKKREISTSYILNKKINSCAVYDGYLYVASASNGVYRGKLSDNLLDNSNWKQLSTDNFASLVTFDNSLYGYLAKDGFYSLAV